VTDGGEWFDFCDSFACRYQEILTDPSYAGQFVLFTCPHIGNVGINEGDMESKKVHLGAMIVRNLALNVSNYRSVKPLGQYLDEQGVIGITDIDTREITRRLRETGCLNGVLTTDASLSDAELVEKAKGYNIVGKDLISEVTCTEPYEWKDTTGEWEFSAEAKANKDQFNVVVYDFGVKHNILRRLASFGCKLTVVPASYPADKVMAMNPDGILFSNGPGDPSAVPYAVENAKLFWASFRFSAFAWVTKFSAKPLAAPLSSSSLVTTAVTTRFADQMARSRSLLKTTTLPSILKPCHPASKSATSTSTTARAPAWFGPSSAQ